MILKSSSGALKFGAILYRPSGLTVLIIGRRIALDLFVRSNQTSVMARKPSSVTSIDDRLLDTAVDHFRATLLCATGWTDVDTGGAAAIRRIIRAHTSAILTSTRGDIVP